MEVLLEKESGHVYGCTLLCSIEQITGLWFPRVNNGLCLIGL